MVRKTKEDALATRDSIIDAAEKLFVTQGVSRTTLQHIASAAGLTRGAIYWHFEDKAALFNALMERVKMPLESAMCVLQESETGDPLGDLREYTMQVLHLTTDDPRAQRALEIATLKMEFVGEMQAVRTRRMEVQDEWAACAERRILAGIEMGLIRPEVPPRAVAIGLFAMIDGLLRTWLLDQQAFNLVEVGAEIVDMHLDSLRIVKKT